MSRQSQTRRTVLRGIGTGAIVLVGGVGAAAADDDTDDRGDGTTAEVRVGHLSPDAPAVDVYVGKEPDGDPTVGGLTYTNFAPNAGGSYLDLEKGTYDVAVTPAGATSPQVIDVDGVELGANRNYTVLAVGELAPEGNEPGIRALPLVDNAGDDTALPPADAALVRFVHASPDAGAVDVEVNGSTLLGGVTFGTASGYYEAPSDATVEIVKDGSTVLGPISNPLDDGQKGTAYVVGNATPEDAPEDGPATDDAGLGAVTTLDATNPSKGRGDRDDDGDEGDEEDEERGRGEGEGDGGRGRRRGDD
ncbi:MAG: DUF4397 domain-containing protein [Haloarculaceae archaeon]